MLWFSAIDSKLSPSFTLYVRYASVGVGNGSGVSTGAGIVADAGRSNSSALAGDKSKASELFDLSHSVRIVRVVQADTKMFNNR
jgi:hypothetical protein